MKIKDVEKLTGLTAKSIRFYEAKGLISVGRNDENDYREYSENEVNELRKIKLFRYLEFSVDEIKEIMRKDEGAVKEALQKKADYYEAQEEAIDQKRSICKELAKKYSGVPQLIDEYNESIEYMESEEYEEIKEDMEDWACPNLPQTITLSCIALAPVFWLFYNIHIGREDALVTNAILALLGTVWATLNLTHYIVTYRRYTNKVKRSNRKWTWWTGVTLVACVIGGAAIVGGVVLINALFVPDNYLFYEHHQVGGWFLMLHIFVPVVLACTLLAVKLTKKSMEDVEWMSDLVFLWNLLGKWRVVAVVVWAIGLYCCITSVTYVTEDEIIVCTPWNPTGTSYGYEDVESVETGFGEKNFAFLEYKRLGNFSYTITVDGKEIVFHQPSVNEDIQRYEEHTYLELEEFDSALMKLGVPKKGSDEGWENCDFDKEFVDRFVRITNSR